MQEAINDLRSNGSADLRLCSITPYHRRAPPPPSGGRAPAPRPARQVSQNTRQMAQGYSKLNQQVSEINQEQSTIERTATARRNDMQALGVQVQG
jgi:hypothetical protein